MTPKLRHLHVAKVIACVGTALTANAAELASTAEPAGPPLYRPLTLGLEAGTAGLGGSVSWRFADHWGARTGFDYFELSDDSHIGSLHYDAKLRLSSEPLTLDFYPWKKHSFRISVGALFNQNRVTGTASDTGTIFPIDGTLKLKIEQQPVNPYLSIAGNFFYFDRAHRWALGGELGVAYTGDSRASLTWSGSAGPLIDAALRREENRAEDDADKYKWLPVVKLTLRYSF